MREQVIEHLKTMAPNRLDNYIVPGLSSELLEQGKVRVFTSSRNQQEFITPHSHRFDLGCLVLEGQVENTIWTPTNISSEGDLYATSTLVYKDTPGTYSQIVENHKSHYRTHTVKYCPGDFYFMDYTVIHSIKFRKDAKVVVFEGPTKTNKSTIIEPIVNGKVVPTFKVEPWMFQKINN